MFLTHRRCKVEGKRKTIAGSSLRDQQCGTSTTAIWLHACIIVVHLQVQLKFSLQVHHTFHCMNTPTAAALQGIALALGQVGGCSKSINSISRRLIRSSGWLQLQDHNPD
jgi:hypothetical protein